MRFTLKRFNQRSLGPGSDAAGTRSSGDHAFTTDCPVALSCRPEAEPALQ